MTHPYECLLCAGLFQAAGHTSEQGKDGLPPWQIIYLMVSELPFWSKENLRGLANHPPNVPPLVYGTHSIVWPGGKPLISHSYMGVKEVTQGTQHLPLSLHPPSQVLPSKREPTWPYLSHSEEGRRGLETRAFWAPVLPSWMGESLGQ